MKGAVAVFIGVLEQHNDICGVSGHAFVQVCCCHSVCVHSVCVQVLTDGDRSCIEKRIDGIIKDNQRFQRVVVSRDEALGMFQENKFKVGEDRTQHV